jgi:phage RecT family recombinase
MNQVQNLKLTLAKASVQEQFKNALAHNAPLFIASLIDIYGGDTNLQKCQPSAVIMEALKAATLRLPINRSLGFAYIVPYGSKPEFQIGYKGYIQLAMRTGAYRYINADVVYEGEFVRPNGGQRHKAVAAAKCKGRGSKLVKARSEHEEQVALANCFAVKAEGGRQPRLSGHCLRLAVQRLPRLAYRA